MLPSPSALIASAGGSGPPLPEMVHRAALTMRRLRQRFSTRSCCFASSNPHPDTDPLAITLPLPLPLPLPLTLTLTLTLSPSP